jgi:hypothetical protein
MAKFSNLVWACLDPDNDIELWDGERPAPYLNGSEWQAESLHPMVGYLFTVTADNAEYLGLGHLEPGKAHRVVIEVRT